METLSEIETAEAARRERAHAYELRVTALRNARSEIARLTPLVAHLREQQKAMDTVARAIQSLDPTLEGHGSYLLREVTRLHLVAAGSKVAARLDKYSKQLAAHEADLPRREAAVTQLES